MQASRTLKITMLAVIGIVHSCYAYAACPALPYMLTNGTSADANQVMANLNSIMNCIATTVVPPPPTQIIPVRQSVASGPIASSGAPSFLPGTSGNLSLAAQNISSSAPLVVSAAAGFDANGAVNANIALTANPTWSGLSTNTTNYLYVNASTGAVGSTTLAPVYQFGGAASTTAGQFTFNIAGMVGYLGNGTGATATPLVFVGEAVTSGSGVTSTIAYAYNGFYDSGWMTPALPGAGTSFSTSHNLGVTPGVKRVVLENLTAELGYSPGDQVSSDAGLYTFLTSSISAPFGVKATRNGVVLVAGAYTAFGAINQADGTSGAINRTNWRQKLVVSRGW